MTRINRLVALGLATFLLFAVASPVTAADHEVETTGETTDTTAVADSVVEGEGPVVVVPAEEAEEVDQPWTARFLIPLLVVTAILLLIGVAIAYNSSIRTRYKVTA
jgi:hypothetical protein